MSINRSPYVNSTAKGKSFNFSEWDSLAAYNNNSFIQDFVSFEDAIYVCINSVDAGENNPKIDTVNGSIAGKHWIQVIKGIPGAKGNDGVTYVPNVSESGVLTWKENFGTPPNQINIKGSKGDPGNSLEFKWNGTKLYVRQVGSSDWFSSPDLKSNKVFVPSLQNGNLIFSLKDQNSVSSEINFGNIKGKDGRPGINGKNGSDGKSGKNGKDGKDGLSAYQIACKNGYIGSKKEWIESLKGKDGNNVLLRVDTDPALFPDENYCGTHIQWKYDSENYTEWRNLIQINQLMNLALGGINLEYGGIVYHNGRKCQHLVLNNYEVDYIDTDGKIVFGNKIRKVSDVYVPVVRMEWSDYDPEPETPLYLLTVICSEPISGATIKLNGKITNEIKVEKDAEVTIEVSAPCYETKTYSVIVTKDTYEEVALNKI